MILVTHAIVGAAIANVFPNHPIVGFSAGFVSHYLLDMVPHSEHDISGLVDDEKKNLFKLNKKGMIHLSIIGLDFIVGVAVSLFFFAKSDQRLYVTLFGILGGVLPDFFQLMYLKFKNQPWKFFQDLHDFFHAKKKLENRQVANVLIHASFTFLIVWACIVL